MKSSATSGLLSMVYSKWHLTGLILIVAAYVLVSIMSVGVMQTLTSETGAIEISSFLLAAYTACLTGWLSRHWGRRFWYVPALLAVFALRELDFHDWFFEPGLLHMGIFESPVPIWMKAVSAVTMITILVTLLFAMFGFVRYIVPAFFRLRGWAVSISVSLVFAVLSQVIDGAGRKLAPYGITLSPETSKALGLLEELLELGFFFLLIHAVILVVRKYVVPEWRAD